MGSTPYPKDGVMATLGVSTELLMILRLTALKDGMLIAGGGDNLSASVSNENFSFSLPNPNGSRTKDLES